MGKQTHGKILKRQFKDSVFTHLFSDPKYLLQLYQALCPEDTTVTEKDLKICTIQNVIVNGLHNDLSFLVKNQLIMFIEAQSTWSYNILFRIFEYFAKTYHDYFTEHDADLYGSAIVDAPESIAYVLYTGDQQGIPEKLNLRDILFKGKRCAFDLDVTLLLDGRQRDIIYQYVSFTKVLDQQVKEHGYSREALENAYKICLDQDILSEYLKSKRSEVMDIMTSLFDQEEVWRRHLINVGREREKIGERRGEKRGEKKGERNAALNIARTALQKGQISIEDIADITGLTVDEVVQVAEELRKNG